MPPRARTLCLGSAPFQPLQEGSATYSVQINEGLWLTPSQSTMHFTQSLTRLRQEGDGFQESGQVAFTHLRSEVLEGSTLHGRRTSSRIIGLPILAAAAMWQLIQLVMKLGSLTCQLSGHACTA